ncbi:M56 family metallopeptidase [Pontibacter actiniarum]|uniref:Peptidase M56 domain-containing protein n=1 Tax=Pontibacter actiniarum TaxID=323450 RepID=A0A1X9YR69_9BACT|nr:M56 family metallopeptidase [Pontibacter actiniarum]ARS35344.1 hypothetical protein CA264_07770 [Pontibacter actiniarum]
MPAAVLYLLKANLALLLFYVAYRLLLRHLTFYTYNRIYLLAALLLSSLFPLLDLSPLYAQPSQLGAELLILLPNWPAASAATAQVQEHDYWQWLLLGYGAGVLVLLGKFILELASLWRLHRHAAPSVWQGQTYRQLSGQVSPFSFWHTVYLNPQLHTEQELEALLLHEQAHTRQLHTLDVLLGQMAKAVYWCNPAAWLLQQDIRQNLEFIADQQVLQRGVPSKTYQYSLVRAGLLPPDSNLVMCFSFNHIKSRIMMMNKEKSNPLNKLKYLLLPPAVAVMVLLTTTSKAEVEQAAQSLVRSGAAQTAGTTASKGSGTSTGLLQEGLVYFVDGKRTDAGSVKSLDPNQIEKVDVLKGEKAQRLVAGGDVTGVVVITTKGGKDSAEAKALQEKINKVNTGAGGSASVSVESTSGVSGFFEAGKDALYFLNGKEISYQKMLAVDPGTITSIEVSKSTDAVEKYGEKGRNGVVHISTK